MAGCKPQTAGPEPKTGLRTQPAAAAPSAGSGRAAAAPLEFSLKTAVQDGRMVYVDAGGDLDGVVNPDLVVQPGNGKGDLKDVLLTITLWV